MDEIELFLENSSKDKNIINRIISSENSQRDAKLFMENKIPPNEKVILLQILEEWDREYYSDECSDGIVRKEAVPIITNWLKNATGYDVAIARKFLSFLTAQKQKRDLDTKSASRMLTASSKRKVKTPRVTKYGVIKPKMLSSDQLITRSNTMGMFQFFPHGTGLKGTNGITQTAAKPHSTRRGSLSSRLRYSAHMQEFSDDNPTIRSLTSARSTMFETQSNHLAPVNPIIAHHKYNYCEPPVKAEIEMKVEDSNENSYTTRAHHKRFYLPEAEPQESVDMCEKGPEIRSIAHHKNNFQLISDSNNTTDEPVLTWAGRKWHHKTLYGQYDFEQRESIENYSPRKMHHKFNYELPT
ncbi:uncharacterized protein LOC100206708 isoform X2 [Hydra vulgaris]|uniref:Uncharacterized protein LOC100206708 isoform X2 n=1 Tax=Hydra vulgaris TaxID=6087 RepID=A0ABM4D0L4_HYDVU